MKEELEARGFKANIVPGPLLLSSTGGRASLPTLMPLVAGSVFAETKGILTRSHIKAGMDKLNPDPDFEMDTRGQSDPKWTTHSIRRMADTNARRFMKENEVTEAEIDIYFGWNERVLLKAMQVHYSTMSIRERMKRARITCKL